MLNIIFELNPGLVRCNLAVGATTCPSNHEQGPAVNCHVTSQLYQITRQKNKHLTIHHLDNNYVKRQTPSLGEKVFEAHSELLVLPRFNLKLLRKGLWPVIQLMVPSPQKSLSSPSGTITMMVQHVWARLPFPAATLWFHHLGKIIVRWTIWFLLPLVAQILNWLSSAKHFLDWKGSLSIAKNIYSEFHYQSLHL